MMTPRERILAVYNGQTPDRVPYMLDLSHYYLHKFQLPWDLCNGYPKPDTGLMDFTKEDGCCLLLPSADPFLECGMGKRCEEFCSDPCGGRRTGNRLAL